MSWQKTNLESGVGGNGENLCSDIGGGADEIHGRSVVFVPNQHASITAALEIGFQTVHALAEHFDALLQGPRDLVAADAGGNWRRGQTAGYYLQKKLNKIL